MEPTEPGFYWANEREYSAGQPKGEEPDALGRRQIVEVCHGGGTRDKGPLHVLACGADDDRPLEWYTNWSEKLVDPKGPR